MVASQKNSKKTLLTGIRASAEIHLGNYFGAIHQALKNQEIYQSYLFVADLHGLTTSPAAEELRTHVRTIAAAWLASGLDPTKTILWKQSDVREHLELAYILSCVTSMGLLERAHSYKDALQKDKIVKMGLFYYPILMAADILLYEADLVPVGKDQAQHLEMTRDMATFFNETYKPLLKLPEAVIEESVAIVPGIDGRKMSKSYGNGILPFAPESEIKKQVMGIKTDSKGLAEPKDPESNTIFQIYKLVSSKDETAEMRERFLKGGYGYGDAKKALLAKILEYFDPMRKRYNDWISNPERLDKVLEDGAVRARAQASNLMSRVRDSVGL